MESSVKYKIELNENALLTVCKSIQERPEVVKLIIESSVQHNFDLNATYGDGETAFHNACKYGHIEVVKVMVQFASEYGIDLAAKNGNGKTAFLSACWNGKTEIVRLLIEQSVDHNFGINTEALHEANEACERFESRPEFVKLIIESSHDLRAKVPQIKADIEEGNLKASPRQQ